MRKKIIARVFSNIAPRRILIAGRYGSGRDHMAVGFTTIYAISTYHH
jgi:hypothetical protein